VKAVAAGGANHWPLLGRFALRRLLVQADGAGVEGLLRSPVDAAQHALREAELTERRYLEVARENRKLRENLEELDQPGFWEEVEALEGRNREGTQLARESKEALERVMEAFPSLQPPAALMERLGHFVAAVAA